MALRNTISKNVVEVVLVNNPWLIVLRNTIGKSIVSTIKVGKSRVTRIM